MRYVTSLSCRLSKSTAYPPKVGRTNWFGLLSVPTVTKNSAFLLDHKTEVLFATANVKSDNWSNFVGHVLYNAQ